jgi:hypothetical protein
MKTFKRPMFRKGGNVGTGIMTGIVDRSMHAENPLVRPEREQSSFIEEIQQGVGPYGGMDPVTSYLLAAGPQISKSTSFADLIANLEDPNKMLIQQAADKAKFDRSIRMEGVKRKLDYDALRGQDQLDYGKLIEGRTYDEGQLEKKKAYEDKKYKEYRDDERMYGKEVADEKHKQRMEEVKAKIQGEKDIAQMRLDATKANDPLSEENMTNFYFKQYGSKIEAKNRAKYEENIKEPMMKKFGSNFGGLVGGDQHGSLEAKKKNKKNIGKAFYDVTDGTVRVLLYKLDENGRKVLDFQIVDDLTTYDMGSKKDSAATKKQKDIQSQKKISDRFRYFTPGQRQNIDDFMESVRQSDKDFPV